MRPLVFENILPIQESGQLKFVDCLSLVNGGAESSASPHLQLANKQVPTVNFDIPSLQIRLVMGHTQSMMLPQIKYKEKTIVYMADLLPSAGHIPIAFVMAYDMNPLITLHEKKSFLTEAVENDYILFFEHDPVHECCNLQRTDRGIRSKDFFKLEEI